MIMGMNERRPQEFVAPDVSTLAVRDRISRALVRAALRRMEEPLCVVFPDGTAHLSTVATETAPVVHIHSSAFFQRVPFSGSIGLGESYMAGEWDADDLVGVVRALTGSFRAIVPWPIPGLHRILARRRAGDAIDETKHSTSQHYDLPNELFELFLDESLSYSAAMYEGAQSLEQAQRSKYEHICELADIGKNDRVLDLGVGWAGFAIYAARTRGCHVTGISVNPDQQELARRRVRDAGEDGLIELRLIDYRQLAGRFDAIVSLEMFEHVGERYWSTYFRCCEHLLADEGRMAMQTITRSPSNYKLSGQSSTFATKYIFPGGMLSSLPKLRRVVRSSPLRIRRSEEIGYQYVPTLAEWRRRFHESRPAIVKLGFNDVFLRMWDFYLAASEAMFSNGTLGDVQLLLTR